MGVAFMLMPCASHVAYACSAFQVWLGFVAAETESGKDAVVDAESDPNANNVDDETPVKATV